VKKDWSLSSRFASIVIKGKIEFFGLNIIEDNFSSKNKVWQMERQGDRTSVVNHGLWK
jgi:hypothetical protein